MKIADKKKAQAWLWKRYKGKCFFCKKMLRKDEATMDHWVPKCFGGTNERHNLRLSCKPCNNKKGNRLPWELPQELVVAAPQ